jgi:glutamine synthetase
MDDREAAQDFLHRHDIRMVRVEWCDLHGLARGKRVSADRFLQSLHRGMRQSGAPLLMDLQGEAPEGSSPWSMAGWPDIHAIADLSTLRLAPGEEATAQVIADLVGPEGVPVPMAPRRVLRRVLARLRAKGWEFSVGPELEFYLFADREATHVPPGRQALRLCLGRRERRCIERLCRELRTAGFEVEAIYAEDGPGQFEINLSHSDPLSAADLAFAFRNLVKQAAAREGLTATFMAKPLSEHSGSGFHLHLSGRTVARGRRLFTVSRKTGRPNATCRRFIAGQLTFARAAAALYLPTVNAYKRIETRGPAPLALCWGADNRSAAVRVIMDEPGVCHIENRIAGADANPYLLTAVVLATGLLGCERRMEPAPQLACSAYAKPGAGERLPTTLREALELLDRSRDLRRALGDEFVDAFVTVKRREAGRFDATVTDWERAEYLPFL